MANKQSTWSPPEPAPLSIGKGAAELREIVVFIDGRTETPGILEFAGILAQEHGARIISVFMQAEHRAQFEDIVRRHGIRSESEWRSLPYFSSEVGVHVYYADLVVIARPESAGQTAGPPGLAESLVLSSGRPIIIFPPRGTVSRVRRILVAWNARREAIRAVSDALPLLVKAEAVEVLVVDHQRRPEGHGQEPGADIARHLARHGAHVLVMGAYGHTQLREWMFGGVTRTVLYEAGLPVLMSR